SRVFGRWQGGPLYYPGTVTAKRGEEIHIHYDDGDEEWTTLSMVRLDRGPPAWHVGDRGLAHWPAEPFWWYPGVIREVQDSELLLHFDDGDRASVSPGAVLARRISDGCRVFGRWKGGPRYYPGIVTQQRGEEIYIEYDDGDEEWTTVGMVRVQIGEPD